VLENIYFSRRLPEQMSLRSISSCNFDFIEVGKAKVKNFLGVLPWLVNDQFSVFII